MAMLFPRGEWFAEVAWLIASTTLLTVAVIKDSSSFRWVWLSILLINAGVVGRRAWRLHRPANADLPSSER